LKPPQARNGDFEPKPTAIVDSGNGIQCLWRLKESIALNDANDIIRHLCLLAATALRRKLLQVAMNPLFAANMIKVENYGRPSRPCERAPAESLPAPKNFFAKASFTERLPPFWDGTIFGQVFVRGGMTKISK
jgi:hypothetical protein